MGIRFKLTYGYVYGMRQGPTYRHDTCHFYPRDAVFTTATCLSVLPSVRPFVRRAPVLCQNEES